MVWLWVVLIFVVIIMFSCIQASSSNEAKSEITSQDAKWMTQNDFNSTSKIEYYDSVYSNGYTIYIDEKKEKMMISNMLSGNRKVFNFDEILGMEIAEDGVSTNGVGRAAVGGVLFGGVGAIVGSNTAKKTVKTIKIIFYLKRISEPRYEIEFTHSNKIKTDSNTYKSIMNFAENVNATVRAINAKNVM